MSKPKPMKAPPDSQAEESDPAAGEAQQVAVAPDPAAVSPAASASSPTPAAIVPPVSTEAAPEGAALPRSPGALRVSAPGGERRRAGFAFGREPRTLTYADIVAAGLDPEAVVTSLLADPQLAVVPLP